MAIVNKYVVRNPFRVVGVYVDDPGKKMDDNVAELRPMVAKGVSFPFPTDLPGKLGPLTRTAAMVEEAVTDLADPERRELERLFWFYGSAGPVSAEAWINQAVRALMDGDIYDALKAYGQSFREVLPQPSVRKQFYSRMYELLGASGDSDPVSKLKYYFGAGETSLIESARPTPKPKPKPQPAPAPAPAPTPAPKPAPAPNPQPAAQSPATPNIGWTEEDSEWSNLLLGGFIVLVADLLLVDSAVIMSVPLAFVTFLIALSQFFIMRRYNSFRNKEDYMSFSAAVPSTVGFVLIDIFLFTLLSTRWRAYLYYNYWNPFGTIWPINDVISIVVTLVLGSLLVLVVVGQLSYWYDKLRAKVARVWDTKILVISSLVVAAIFSFFICVFVKGTTSTFGY